MEVVPHFPVIVIGEIVTIALGNVIMTLAIETEIEREIATVMEIVCVTESVNENAGLVLSFIH